MSPGVRHFTVTRPLIQCTCERHNTFCSITAKNAGPQSNCEKTLDKPKVRKILEITSTIQKGQGHIMVWDCLREWGALGGGAKGGKIGTNVIA